MAFNKKIELIVGDPGSGLLISALNISFVVERSTEEEYNTAEIVIYNAKSDTRNKILVPGKNVTLKAGYEDEGVGTIFIGTITKSVSVQDNTEWTTTISAQDIGSNKNPLEYGIISLKYKSNVSLSAVFSDVATTLNIPIAGIENVAGIILRNGFVQCSNITALINRLKKILSKNELELYFDSSELVIYKKYTQVSRFGAVRISPQSGLIGSVSTIIDENEQDKKKRISFTSLLNYRIRPAGVVSVVSNDVKGAYIVEKVTFEGDNLDGGFIATVEAVE